MEVGKGSISPQHKSIRDRWMSPPLDRYFGPSINISAFLGIVFTIPICDLFIINCIGNKVQNITFRICVCKLSCWECLFVGYPIPSIAMQICVGYCICMLMICGVLYWALHKYKPHTEDLNPCGMMLVTCVFVRYLYCYSSSNISKCQYLECNCVRIFPYIIRIYPYIS